MASPLSARAHTVGLVDGAWSLWTWACLRGAGFAANGVLALASPLLARAADRALACEVDAERARVATVEACRAARPDDPEARRALQRALRKLWARQLPGPIADARAEAARQQWQAALAAREVARAELDAAYAEAQRATADALREVARDDRFRRALTWQNASAVSSGVDALLRRAPDADDSETRGKQRMVASYLQRYCVKNDTIGFFGPCGWARLTDDAAAIVQQPGPALLASRALYYEYWAIDALASRFATALRPALAPRRLPHTRLEGDTLYYGARGRAALPDEHAAVLRRCDGVRSAQAIAREVMVECAELDEAAVFELLDELVAQRVLAWGLEIPTATPHPERYLADALARLADVPAAAEPRALLAGLETRRAAISAATTAGELAAALSAFDAAFTSASGASSQRAHGQTYAARTPLYEECRRDHALVLGRPVVERLAAPLSLLLASARWYTHEIAARYRAALTAQHRALGGGELDFLAFWPHVTPLFPGARAEGSIAGAVRAELQRRWAEVLAVAPDERVVQRRAAALAEAVHAQFEAPGPGWPAARHHSPDVMIAAAGPDAIARGDFALVIGEMHTGFNTIAGPFLKLHPTPEALIAARDADLVEPGIAPVWSKAVTGADYYSPSPRDFDLELGDAVSARPRDHVIAASALVVRARDGALEVATRDGAHRFDLIAFLEHHLIAESYAAFSLVASAAWSPRIAIDDVVIARATWRLAPGELAWPKAETPSARFVGARRWARELGLPRWVFCRTIEEVKPVYVDFDSAIYVELLAAQLRRASAATVSEMLPAIDETWLEDAAGARYTAELRIAALDPRPWRP